MELNRLNQQIESEQDRIQKLLTIKERDEHYQKNLKQQQQFNSALAVDHKAQTTNMKQVMKGEAAAVAQDGA